MCRSALSTAYQSYTHIFILFHFFFTLYSKPWTLEPKNALVHLALCLQHPAKTDALLDLSQVRQNRGGHWGQSQHLTGSVVAKLEDMPVPLVTSQASDIHANVFQHTTFVFYLPSTLFSLLWRQYRLKTALLLFLASIQSMKGADKDTVTVWKVKNKVVESTTTPTRSVLRNKIRWQPSLQGWWMGLGGGPDSQTFPGHRWALKRQERMRRDVMRPWLVFIRRHSILRGCCGKFDSVEAWNRKWDRKRRKARFATPARRKDRLQRGDGDRKGLQNRFSAALKSSILRNLKKCYCVLHGAPVKSCSPQKFALI